mmetsp:Transcript_11483/g.18741  ORF Transcript_11483/g.18741 Transcript_11483/m.18741 type:complete len:1481 (+) Transcript_11483:112-4554(+)|eukprot:CAMPEP_0114462862 /NCGR_PEP_ID=MMETSP0104-20121206/7053_1 /TAXON_ID=37642 ORGANISM="Paraphysomonas imperforata, Strain PA2" /NCGR_SAMPLE_ID=MMETSP0104 /ASSEMBLY_ACC=CAM_ASM_000202 /LENGTH=1480 /DNA_ID=CAMNT_0001635765 /DNA_START=35 /DNA_END=4477 /DNA_ORIENTATION=+
MSTENTTSSSSTTEITKALSSFGHFQKLRTNAIKEELARNEQDHSMGAIMTALSARFKALTDDEKAEYDDLAAKDKDRFNHETALRDAEYLAIQEERRRQNATTSFDSRARNSTIAMTDAAISKAEAPKRKRVVTEAEKEARERTKQAKAEEERRINVQHDAISESKSAQAEARLKYLLSQSDIFSHFGLKGSQKTEEAPTPSKAERDRDRKKDRKGVVYDELDDDERALMEDAGGDSDSEEDKKSAGKKGKQQALLRQPAIITGGELRNYQLEGLNWMIRLIENGINGILADEMGLGKTLQSISILAYCHEYLNITGPHLIVVPKSTLSNWMNELKRWCPTLRGVRFHGDKAEREELKATVLNPSMRTEDREWDVCVTTYEIFNLEVTAFRRMAWRYLIIDEAHRLKNEASQFSTNIRVLNTEHRLLLTGTPLQNNLHELWALLNFLLPDVFSSSEEFDEWFNLDVDDTEAKQRMISQLHKILRPFMLRRLKADVEKSLLPKTETILFTGLSVMQKNLYRQILLRDIDQINGSMAAAGSGSNSQGGRTAILNIVMQLRKCCNHPYLFPGIEDRTLNPYGDHLFYNCGKMSLLDKLLKKLKERGNRVLIFSQMTRMLDILEDYFALREYSYCRIDGNTTYDDREDRIAAYNAPGSEIFIFLLSTRAGGLGINLQTADTVIIYDSDWNPQADLQAQDRCHRIGQKKQVHVYRLVTDDTVEVKVVERAQQKLKLDAMVVQQGRLAEKEKKMTKNDLLDTLRFGADSIFRTKDSSSITDADIENILLDGEKRTKEMSAQFEAADKGDMYDFSFDGSLGTQEFEGVDYSDKATRGGQTGIQSDGYASFGFIETGPRERKAIINYSDGTSMRSQAGGTADKKQPKIPRHLRLPKMEDWQFFNRERLQELQDEENELFDKLVDKDEIPSNAMLSKLVLLDDEKQAEKQTLLDEAFGDWNRYHYTSFVKASGKYGRHEYEKISEDVGHSPEEVERYSKAFWSKAQDFLSSTDYERHVKTIEKGEKRLEDIDRLTRATSRLVAMFRDPWEELTFRHIGNQGRLFNAIEDRYLLCLTHLHGYGNWDRVRSSIRRCERFRFNYYLLSCSAEALGKRCEALMRAAEREMTEIDKKQQAVDSAHSALNAATAAPTAPVAAANMSKFANLTSLVQNGDADIENKNSSNEQSGASGVESTQSLMNDTLEGNHGRLAELLKQISEESRKLAATRAELQKAKKVSISSSSKQVSDANGASSKAKSNIDSVDNRTERKGAEKKGVPEILIPELCQLLARSGADGISKVQDKFTTLYPNISKRQVELEALKMFVKEKRGKDSMKMWHVRPFYAHLLDDKKDAGAPEQAKTPKSTKKKGSITDFMVKSGSTPSSSTGKRKHSDSSSTPHGDKASPAGGTEKKKSKPKTAFQLYVKEHRSEAEAALGDAASDTTALKNRLLEMWHALKKADRVPYEKMEAAEKVKFEMRSGGSGKKKAKR